MTAEALSTGPARRAAPKIPYGRVALRSAGLPLVIVGGAILLLAPGMLAKAHPHLHWPRLALIAQAPLVIQVHLYTILAAIACGVILMTGIKGVRMHRIIGWAFAGFMLLTAFVALFIPAAPGLPHIGHFGVLHLFSLLVLVQVPRALWAARRHQAMAHGRGMSAVFFGGLMLTSVFAFLPGRLIWQVFFG